MQKKKIISSYLSLANYIADTVAIEIKTLICSLKIKLVNQKEKKLNDPTIVPTKGKYLVALLRYSSE